MRLSARLMFAKQERWMRVSRSNQRPRINRGTGGREGGGVWKEGDGAEGWRKREARRNWGNERVKRAMRKDSCGWREGGEGGGQ